MKRKVKMMKKLSDLNDDTLLVVDGKFSYQDVIMTKDELVSQINSGDIAKDEIYVYLAKENPVSLTMDDLREWMEQIEDQHDQYAYWYDDMMFDLIQSEEAKAFIEVVNRLAHEHMSYDGVGMVDVWH